MNRRTLSFAGLILSGCLLFAAAGCISDFIYLGGLEWSPDATRVLFPYTIPDDEHRQGYAVYDLRTRKVTPVFELSIHSTDRVAAAQWTGDGRDLLISVMGADTAEVDVFRLPAPGAGGRKGPGAGPLRMSSLSGDTYAIWPLPPQVLGSALFLGGQAVTRFDLDSLKVTEGTRRFASGDSSLYLIRWGTRILYLPTTEDMLEGPPDEVFLELGEVDPLTLELRPIGGVTQEDVAAVRPPLDPESLTCLAPGPGPRELTVLFSPERALLVIGAHGVERILRPAFPPLPPGTALGKLAWSADGATAYLNLFAPGPDSASARWSVAEYAPSSGRVAILPIAIVPESDVEGLASSSEISLSPDGRMLAAIPRVQSWETRQHGLVLVDLRDSHRKVTRVPYPPTPR